MLGTPGCGKTATAHAVGRYFLDLCGKAGLEARMRVIRRTDWASAYQNQSANTLLEIFKREVFNAPGVCGGYWHDIDTAFAARGDSDIRQEEKSILGTLFGILDGTVGPRNGRWFLLCDANTLNMDEATLSRISQNHIRARGPAAPEDFEEPDEYFSMHLDRERALIAELSRPVATERILKMIGEYCRFERDSQLRSEEERFLNRVREIRFHLSAQREAPGKT